MVRFYPKVTTPSSKQRSSDYLRPLSSKWKPNFQPSLEEISSTMAWVQLSELHVKFFIEILLMRVGNKVGKAVKVDDTMILAM